MSDMTPVGLDRWPRIPPFESEPLLIREVPLTVDGFGQPFQFLCKPNLSYVWGYHSGRRISRAKMPCNNSATKAKEAFGFRPPGKR